jgi:hypothetical protein
VERFGGDGNGKTKESKAGADTGWKSRLGFPSKKKKEEPQPELEDVPAAATFRDFRKVKGKPGANVPLTVKEPSPPGQEPGLVPDIPRDITPEELDALSALAAKLDGPTPAPVAEMKTEVKKEIEPPAPVVEVEDQAQAEAETAAAGVVPAASVVEAKSEIAAQAAVEVHQHETEKLETEQPETPAAVVAVEVNTALLAQVPAPVDRDDEPKFAAAASAVEPVAGEKAEEKIEAKPSAEAVAKSEAVEAEEPTPSAEELAEALRLLTPAIGNADGSTVPSIPARGTLVAAGQVPAEEAARNATTGPRWIAEPVALTAEESAISLEAEMFSTFAATFAAASGGKIESAGITGVSAIAAAVENRLVEAGLAASAKASSEQGTERRPAETVAAEAAVVAAPAEVVATASPAASPAVDGIEPEKIISEKIGSENIGPKKLEPEKFEGEKLEAEQKDSPANVAEEAPAEEVAAVTFADAVSKDEVEVKAEQIGELVSATTAAVAGENHDSSSDSGGQDSMGKDVKTKSGKSNWHQIHTAPAIAAANSDAVEAAKQAEPKAEESPKAMAAAAAEGSASISAADASTIASIVDSVMADLRPKIVEEIAKKLAKRD